MPISLKNMKGCASPASTAICTSVTDNSSGIRHSSTVFGAGTPHHRRLTSYLHDQHTSSASITAPCISELPITPRSLYRKGSSSLKTHFSGDGDIARRKSSTEIRDYLRRRRSADIERSPPGSSRHLLRDTASIREDLSEYEKNLKKKSMALVISEPVEEVTEVGSASGVVGKTDDLVRSSPLYWRDSGRSRSLVPGDVQVKPSYKGSTYAADGDGRLRLSESREALKSSSSVSPARSGHHHQVVVLRVSLHCRGCVAKLRKHLSKLQGVSSFSIDLETKRVMVTGSMSPLDVLTNITKVMKNAQLWPCSSTSSSSITDLTSL